MTSPAKSGRKPPPAGSFRSPKKEEMAESRSESSELSSPETLGKKAAFGASQTPSPELPSPTAHQLPSPAHPPPRSLKPIQPSPWHRRPGAKLPGASGAASEEQVFPPLGPKSVSSSPVRYNLHNQMGRHHLDPITPPSAHPGAPGNAGTPGTPAAHLLADPQHPAPQRPALSPVGNPPGRSIPPHTRYRVDLPAPKLASLAARPLRLEELESPENVLSKLARHKNRNLIIRTDSPVLNGKRASPLPDKLYKHPDLVGLNKSPELDVSSPPENPPAGSSSPNKAETNEIKQTEASPKPVEPLTPVPPSTPKPPAVRSPKNTREIIGAFNAVGFQQVDVSQQLLEKWAVLLKDQEADPAQVDQWKSEFEQKLARGDFDEEASSNGLERESEQTASEGGLVAFVSASGLQHTGSDGDLSESAKMSTLSSVPESIISSGQDFTDSASFSLGQSSGRDTDSLDSAVNNGVGCLDRKEYPAIAIAANQEGKLSLGKKSAGRAVQTGDKPKAPASWISRLAPDRLPSPPLCPSYSEAEIEAEMDIEERFDDVADDDDLQGEPELGDDDGEAEMLSLVYDPTLMCYYERSTGRYFKLKGGTDMDFPSIDTLKLEHNDS